MPDEVDNFHCEDCNAETPLAAGVSHGDFLLCPDCSATWVAELGAAEAFEAADKVWTVIMEPGCVFTRCCPGGKEDPVLITIDGAWRLGEGEYGWYAESAAGVYTGERYNRPEDVGVPPEVVDHYEAIERAKMTLGNATFKAFVECPNYEGSAPAFELYDEWRGADEPPPVPAGDHAVYIVAVRMADGEPFAIPASYLNELELTEGLDAPQVVTGWREARGTFGADVVWFDPLPADLEVVAWHVLPSVSGVVKASGPEGAA